MNRMRLCTAFAALAFVAVLAGCGRSTSGETQSQSLIPRGVANKLAAQSEAIAASAEGGNDCGAAHEADDLKEATDAAISAGQIPVAYRDELETAVTDLQNTLNCAPKPPQHENENKDEGKKKGQDKDAEGDTTGVTITTDTLTGTTTESGG
jgi:hypothetical protein